MRRPARTTTISVTTVTAMLGLCLSACGSGNAPANSTGNETNSTSPSTTLTVFAAASLKGSFTQLGKDFGAAHPGTQVRFTFDGSSSLVDQLAGGAPADVFAAADERNMSRAVEGKLVTGTPAIFATNVLTLVVAPGNPDHITGLDNSLDGRKLVICAVGVPCGNATATLSKNLGVTLKPVSTEQKVTDVLGKVTSGEADAGLVYTTDAKAAGSAVAAVAIPGAEKVVNRYPIAVAAASQQASAARQFVDFVTGAQGRSVLAGDGFGAP